MDKINRNVVVSVIEANNSGECHAMSGYYELLSIVNDSDLITDDKTALSKDIREIIADEMNHRQKLAKWSQKLSSIKPAGD